MRPRAILTLALSFTYLIIGWYWIGKLTPKKEIDPYLARYYNAFADSVDINCYMREFEEPNQIVVKFGKLDDETIGTCGKNIFGYEITIDKDSWEFSDEETRYQLMFHEAGHCMLNLEHSDNPRDIMYDSLVPLHMNVIVYQANKLIMENCSLWRQNEFNPIKIRN